MIEQIQHIFGEAGNITSFITLSATILGAISLLLSNLARYMQANRYGIPIKAIYQASIGDSIGIWITLISTLGFGVFVPLFFLNIEAGWWVIYIAIAVSFFLSQGLSKTYTITGNNKEREFNGEVFVSETDITRYFQGVISLVAGVAYMHVRNMYRHTYVIGYDTPFAEGFFAHLRLYGAFFMLAVYVLLIAATLIISIMDKLFGGREKMLTEIDGQAYLVAMRNSQYHWVLIPCELTNVVYKKLKSGGVLGNSYIRFERGKFLICDMSHPPKEIRRAGGTLVEKGLPKVSKPDS